MTPHRVGRWALGLAGLLVLTACPDDLEPKGPTAPVPTAPEVPGPAPEAPAPAPPSTPEPDPEPTNPLAPGGLGFSADGGRFAYVARSEAAGMDLFTVVETSEGRRLEDFPLVDEAARARALALLEDHGFDQTPHPLPEGVTIETEADEEQVLHLTWRSGGRRRDLRPNTAFTTMPVSMGRPVARLWGTSADGRFVAFEVRFDAGDELGAGVTYHVVPMNGKTASGGRE